MSGVQYESLNTGMPSVDARWIQIQKRTFTGWCNQHLKSAGITIKDLSTELEDGIPLIKLLEVISCKDVVPGGKYNKKPRIRAQKLENCGWSLRFLKDEGIRLVAIGPEDLVDKNTKLILGLIWTIILRYHIQKGGASTSAKNDLLKWVQRTIPECNVKDFTSSWNDGKAICHLTDALERGTIDLGPVDSNPDALANAQLGERKAEEVLGIPQILDPRDMVAPDADELSVMTYISYFRDYEEAKKKKMGDEAREKTADPSKCVAFGPGIEGGEQFVPQVFTIQAKNCFDRNLKAGGDKFECVMKAPNRRDTLPVDVVDNSDGTYTCRYTPLDAGPHVASISLNRQAIKNSPYTVPIDRSSITASGPGLSSAEVFVPAKFTIHATKLHAAGAAPQPNEWGVSIAAPRGTLQPTVSANGDGTYDVAYTPNDTGRHTINLTFKQRPVASGPYYVSVDKSSVMAHGPGVERGEQFIPTDFVVDAKKLKDAGVPVSPMDVAVSVNGPRGPVQAAVADNGDGTFKVDWTPLDPGRHTVNVTVKGQPIGNGPFPVAVDKSTVSAYGPGLERGEVLAPCEFTIDAKVLKKHNVPAALNELEVSINAPKGKLEPSITDAGDGTFKVVYNPTDVGRHNISLGLRARSIAQSPYSVPIEKSGVSAYGPGLEGGEQYIPTEFTIHAKNLHDKGVALNNSDVAVTVDGPNGAKVPVEIKNNDDGTFRVDYTPQDAGAHKIEVKLKDQQVGASPFRVVIDKSKTDAKRCTAEGPGIEPGIVLGKPTQFTITARNKIGDQMKVGGDQFKVRIKGPYGSDPEATVKDNSNGTYTVEYEPDVPGEHEVDVTLNAIGIEKNPFHPTVVRDPEAIDPEHCVAFGPGLEGGTNAQPCHFTVQAKNGRGEDIKRGGHPLEVEVFAPNGEECDSSLKDNNDGTYSATYSTAHIGTHKVDVVLKAHKFPMYFDHIKSSPFNVPIIAGTDAAKSKCWGPGLENGKVFDTLPTEFHIQANDRDGNPITKGGDPFKVKVTAPDGTEVPAEVIDNNDGTYDVKYAPEVHGPHKIDVDLLGKPVANAPYTVDVLQGAYHGHSVVEEYSFIVRAKTKTGENKKSGGDNFTCDIIGPEGPCDFVRLVDNKDGSYTVTYSIMVTGDYTIHVKVDGKEIRGSPWKQCHSVTAM